MRKCIQYMDRKEDQAKVLLSNPKSPEEPISDQGISQKSTAKRIQRKQCRKLRQDLLCLGQDRLTCSQILAVYLHPRREKKRKRRRSLAKDRHNRETRFYMLRTRRVLRDAAIRQRCPRPTRPAILRHPSVRYRKRGSMSSPNPAPAPE